MSAHNQPSRRERIWRITHNGFLGASWSEPLSIQRIAAHLVRGRGSADDITVLYQAGFSDAASRRSLLCQAALSSRLIATAALLNIGAEPDRRDTRGMTALMWAARFDDPDIAVALLDGGADPNIKNPDGRTAMELAHLHDSHDFIRAVTERGAGLPAPAQGVSL